MIPIICENDLQVLLDKIQEHLNKGSKIGGIKLVDHTDKQIVALLSDSPISKEVADVWWSGYVSGLHSALE